MTVLHTFDRSPDEIRVSVAVPDSPGTVPEEVFSLNFTMGGLEVEAIERLITKELKVIITDPALPDWPPAPNALHVEWDSVSWGGSHAILTVLLEISLAVGSQLTVTRIEAALRRIAAEGHPDDVLLTEEEAEHKARYELAFWYGKHGVQVGTLKRTAVGQDLSSGRWSFTFQNGEEYEIELGFVRGIPSSTRIKRTVHSGDPNR